MTVDSASNRAVRTPYPSGGCQPQARSHQPFVTMGHPSPPIITRGLGSRLPCERADSAAVFSLWHVLHMPVRLSRSSVPPSNSGMMWSQIVLGAGHRQQVGSSLRTRWRRLCHVRPRVLPGDVPCQAIDVAPNEERPASHWDYPGASLCNVNMHRVSV